MQTCGWSPICKSFLHPLSEVMSCSSHNFMSKLDALNPASCHVSATLCDAPKMSRQLMVWSTVGAAWRSHSPNSSKFSSALNHLMGRGLLKHYHFVANKAKLPRYPKRTESKSGQPNQNEPSDIASGVRDVVSSLMLGTDMAKTIKTPRKSANIPTNVLGQSDTDTNHKSYWKYKYHCVASSDWPSFCRVVEVAPQNYNNGQWYFCFGLWNASTAKTTLLLTTSCLQCNPESVFCNGLTLLIACVSCHSPNFLNWIDAKTENTYRETTRSFQQRMPYKMVVLKHCLWEGK